MVLNPKTIIEEIRKEYTGEGLVSNSDWNTVVKRNNEALSRALEQLSENLYKKKFHFIMELVQNAEDNQYSRKVHPFISFTLRNDRLIVRNNEMGFSEENVRAICDVNKTTKKKIDGYIGEKGIGFKSVFKVSESPEIYSNGFSFRFKSGKRKRNPLAYILPEWIDDIPDYVDPRYTNIVLPYKGSKPDEFRKQLDQLHPNLLLFLKKLAKIVIYDDSSNIKRILEKKVLKEGVVKVSEYKERNGSILESNEYYYLLRPFVYPVFSKALVGSEERKGLKSTEIIIGFPIHKNNGRFSLITNEDCFLYSYLPIKDVGFRFLIQADFILNSSREDINEAKFWNEWILDKINSSIIKALLSLRYTSYWNDYLNLLPRENDLSDETFKIRAEDLISLLKKEQLIPVKTSDNVVWVLPSKTIQYNTGAYEIIGNRWIKKIVKKELFHPLANIDYNVCELLEIDSWDWKNIVRCLENPMFISSLDESGRNKLYAYLSDRAMDYANNITDLKELPIFFVNGSLRPQSYNQSDDAIFWPINSRYKYSFLKSLRFLKTDYNDTKSVQNLKIRSLFTTIGVRNASIKQIIKNYIIPKYTEGDNNSSAGNDLIKYSSDFFRFFVENYTTIRKDNDLFKQIKDNIWLHSDSNNKHNRPGNLYLGSSYQKTIEWEKFLIGEEVCFLNPKYKACLEVPQHRTALKFLDDIGIKRTASISHLIQAFSSRNKSRIKYALIYLDSNWDLYKNKSDIKTLKSSIVVPAILR